MTLNVPCTLTETKTPVYDDLRLESNASYVKCIYFLLLSLASSPSHCPTALDIPIRTDPARSALEKGRHAAELLSPLFFVKTPPTPLSTRSNNNLGK